MGQDVDSIFVQHEPCHRRPGGRQGGDASTSHFEAVRHWQSAVPHGAAQAACHCRGDARAPTRLRPDKAPAGRPVSASLAWCRSPAQRREIDVASCFGTHRSASRLELGCFRDMRAVAPLQAGGYSGSPKAGVVRFQDVRLDWVEPWLSSPLTFPHSRSTFGQENPMRIRQSRPCQTPQDPWTADRRDRRRPLVSPAMQPDAAARIRTSVTEGKAT